MTEWDLTQQILDIEAAKTDLIIQHRLNELGWVHVPEGYVLVPVEPTEEMVEEACSFHDENIRKAYQVMIRVAYQVMIRVAQEEE